MSDLLLLRDAKVCPACLSPTAPKYFPGQCRTCGKMLFKHDDNFLKYEAETGFREYWLWTGKDTGWKHRSHFIDNDGKLRVKHRAFERVQKEEKLDDDYATPQWNKRRIANSRFELKEEIRIRKKHKGRKIFAK